MTARDEEGETTAPKLGRRRSYDDDLVLDALVELFWEKGFAGSSLVDIVEATGLSKSSLYNSFGSKEALFQQALDLYITKRSFMVADVLHGGTGGLSDVNAFLDGLREQFEDDDVHPGCLAVNTSTELGSSDDKIVDVGARYRSILRDGLTAALDRAVALGEISHGQVPHLANALVSTMLGLAVIMRSGASAAEVQAHLSAIKHLLPTPNQES